MTAKSDLIKSNVKETGLSLEVVTKVVDTLLTDIAKSLTAGEDVKINGFGQFMLKKLNARQGRNPATGESIQIPASTGLKFKPSAELKKVL